MSTPLRSNVVFWPTDALPLRGCAVCDFGRDLALDPADWGKLCRHPSVAKPNRSVPTDPARGPGDACGRDARYLTIKGIEI